MLYAPFGADTSYLSGCGVSLVYSCMGLSTTLYLINEWTPHFLCFIYFVLYGVPKDVCLDMKRLFFFFAANIVIGCSQIDELADRVDNLESRMTRIEEICSEINTNISSMQVIITALQNNDYITHVEEILDGGISVGYMITFSKSGTITIYHGKDGVDGKDGNDGKDGIDGKDGLNGVDGKDGVNGKDGTTPIIGIAIHDGLYYWTLNGEWLLDENGEMICVSGEDGSDGKDGQNGHDGKDGKPGEDGITPQLKIENDYWLVSYDNGVTWHQLGKATGNNGSNGMDGKDGDSLFNAIDYTSNSSYVIFTLADGTCIKVPTWAAFEELYLLVNQLNTNISSVQSIINALQNNDYLLSIDTLFENGKEIGYKLNFSKSDSITIYHGKDGIDGTDGKDGQNGTNGKDGKPGEDGEDGKTPKIGISLGYGGLYYWTLNDEFLLDENGNPICVSGQNGTNGDPGQDGKDGIDGEDGKDGQDGKDGKDGITPLLDIENGYWVISYDNGVSWTSLDCKAEGENGINGDSFFQDVSWDNEHLHMTLSNGETISIPISEKKLNISIDKELPLVIQANQTITLNYSVTIDSNPTECDICVSYNGNLKAKHTADINAPGYGTITITATGEVDEYSSVIIMASDGVRSAMKCLSFEKGVLCIVGDNEVQFPSEGGELSLEYLTNLDVTEYTVNMSNAHMVGFAPMTKSASVQSKKIFVYPNEYDGNREAEIEIVEDRDNGLRISWKIKQAASENYLSVADDLMVLYNALGGENWTNNTNWGTEEPWESWYGVMADTEEIAPGYYIPSGVYAIGLSDNNLNGQLPETIGELFPNLNSLILRGNPNLTGELPQSIGQLANLDDLDCARCGFTGAIPTTLGNCQQLKRLYLDYNSLSGTIPAEIAKCNYLETFFVDHNKLSGALPQEFYYYSNLNARFEYNCFTSLPDNIDQFKWMEYIAFSHNQISSIPESVYSMDWIKSIDLSHNELEMPFPVELCKMSNLIGFNLGGNKIYGNIPAEIGNMTNLCSLEMSGTYLGGEIPDELYNLYNLERLHLGHYDFDADGNVFEYNYIANYNGLTGDISERIGNLSKLTYLDLSCNSLAGEIPDEICNCTNLEYLYLADNNLTGAIPSDIGNLNNLYVLSLSFNNLSGNIPESFYDLTSMTNLHLQGGEFTINPDALGRLRREKNNRFTGTLSSYIGNFINLRQLELTCTYMTGNLPNELFELPNLSDVLLINNRFSGTLPASARSANWWKDERILNQQDGYTLSISQ